MKPLTQSQIMAALNLAKHPLIAEVGVEVNNNGSSRIRIESVVGADYNEVDSAMDAAISKEFADYEYMGLPIKYVNPVDGIEQELYFINWEGETLFDLIMRIAPAKWTAGQVLGNEA